MSPSIRSSCFFLAAVASAGCVSAPRLATKPQPTIIVRDSGAGFAGEVKQPLASSEIATAAKFGEAESALPDAPSNVLSEFTRRALELSPSVKQAAADVAAARGTAIQAGLYPNPKAGYQGDQIGSGHTAGQQGGFISQTIVTKGKLGLAQAAAFAEVTRTEAALDQARADVSSQVEARYYTFQAAVEGVRLAEEMARKVEALAERQKKLADSGQAIAPHELAQGKALVATARGELLQARNRRVGAEKQFLALVGRTEQPLAEAGAIPQILPSLSFDALKRQILAEHSELRAATAMVERNRLQLELARVTPIPNVETNSYVQYDYQARTPQFGVQIGVALPVFDRNQGNIAQAEANLVRATHEADRVRLELTQRLADAFEKYSTSRQLLEQYRNEILPEQLKASDGLAKRFEQEPGKVTFTEVILAQQTLANTYAGYLSVLNSAWQAAAELTRITQKSDLGTIAPATRDSWPDPALKR